MRAHSRARCELNLPSLPPHDTPRASRHPDGVASRVLLCRRPSLRIRLTVPIPLARRLSLPSLSLSVHRVAANSRERDRVRDVTTTGEETRGEMLVLFDPPLVQVTNVVRVYGDLHRHTLSYLSLKGTGK